MLATSGRWMDFSQSSNLGCRGKEDKNYTYTETSGGFPAAMAARLRTRKEAWPPFCRSIDPAARAAVRQGAIFAGWGETSVAPVSRSPREADSSRCEWRSLRSYGNPSPSSPPQREGTPPTIMSREWGTRAWGESRCRLPHWLTGVALEPIAIGRSYRAASVETSRVPHPPPRLQNVIQVARQNSVKVFLFFFYCYYYFLDYW